MSKPFQITLESNDLGQILDGLRARAESWRNTEIFLRADYFPDDSFVAEECSDADEAENVAAHYRSIVAQIEKQVAEQGGW